MKMNRKACVILSVGMVFFTSCSFYHMQTPETVPVGKISGGIGMVGLVDEGDAYAFPGLWIRSGLAPKFDLGVSTWGPGMKLDGKYGFNKSFGLGAGFAGAFLGAFVYNLEGSLYAGVPAGLIYPYAVARINMLGISANAEDETFDEFGSLFTGVIGFRLNPGSLLKIYLEGGAGLPMTEDGGGARAVFGFGVGFGQ